MNNKALKSHSISIHTLLKQPLISSKNLREKGYSPGLLTYYEKKGVIRKVARGLYINVLHPPEIDLQWEDLVYTVLSIPNGVVTGVSALALYEVTEEIPRQHWISVPNATSIGKRKNTRIIRQRNHKLGISNISVGDIKIPIYDLERTLIEAFCFLSIETAIKALKFAFKSPKHRPSLRKFARYSKVLRTNINEYLLMVTT